MTDLLIARIATRASELAAKQGQDIPAIEFMMDVQIVHEHLCPLNLQGLLDATNGNFTHDIFGIRRHLNRATGMLEDCFLPRYSI